VKNLDGKVALVTGATRGVGKGVGLELAAAGALVYVTGRSVSPEVFGANERIISITCDHTNDAEVAAVFDQINKEQGRVDILVNNVWGGYENMVENGQFTWMLHFGTNHYGVGTRCSRPVSVRITWPVLTPPD